VTFSDQDYDSNTIDRLLNAVLLLIHEVQKLPPPLNQSAKFDFVIGLSNLRRWSHDFAKSRDDLRINRIGLGVLADAFSEVSSLAWINHGQRDFPLVQELDQQRLIAAGGFHYDDRIRCFQERIDPCECGSSDGSGLK